MEIPVVKQPAKTLRFGKYVVGAELLWPTRRYERLPGTWCTIPELVERFPSQVTYESLGQAQGLPEFRFQYTGSDARYSDGVMPATIIPGDFLLRIKGGRAYGRHCVVYGPDGTGLQDLDHEGRSLAAFRRLLPGGRFHPRYWIHTLTRLRQTHRLPAAGYRAGKVAALNAPGSHNYFHWMMDILPRLVALRKGGIVPDWYLIDAYSRFQLQTLKALDVPLERVIQPYSGLHIQAEELIVPICHYPGACLAVQQALIQPVDQTPACRSSGRIFVNRRSSRKPGNAEAFSSLLQQYGFQEHYLEDYSFSQQVALFQQAEAVVGMHGAGLTNLVFCMPGTAVIELMPEGKFQVCYPLLSRSVGLRHYLLSATRTGLHQDMLVPLETIGSLLGEIFARPSSAPRVVPVAPARRAA